MLGFGGRALAGIPGPAMTESARTKNKRTGEEGKKEKGRRRRALRGEPTRACPTPMATSARPELQPPPPPSTRMSTRAGALVATKAGIGSHGPRRRPTTSSTPRPNGPHGPRSNPSKPPWWTRPQTRRPSAASKISTRCSPTQERMHRFGRRHWPSSWARPTVSQRARPNEHACAVKHFIPYPSSTSEWASNTLGGGARDAGVTERETHSLHQRVHAPHMREPGHIERSGEMALVQAASYVLRSASVWQRRFPSGRRRL